MIMKSHKWDVHPQVLPRGCVKELAKRLDREHAVTPCGTAKKRPGPVMVLTGVAVHGANEDIRVEREAALNGHGARHA